MRGLYERTGNDPRLLPFISPMAPFLDPGSRVFDDPAKYGYRMLATTLEEHRQLLLEPSWRYIMNYESDSMPKAELVDATYQAAVDVNRAKAAVGAVPAQTAAATEKRIGEARGAMARIDEIMAGDPAGRASSAGGLPARGRPAQRVDRVREERTGVAGAGRAATRPQCREAVGVRERRTALGSSALPPKEPAAPPQALDTSAGQTGA